MKKLMLSLLILGLGHAEASQITNSCLRPTIESTSRGVLPLFYGKSNKFVEAKYGETYNITLSNLCDKPVLTVVSVDGVNVISGEDASTEQTGYVLSPGQTYQIKGWRKSLTSIASFSFTSQGKSYASKTGRPDNTGIIGIASFYEKESPPSIQKRYSETLSYEKESKAKSMADAGAAPQTSVPMPGAPAPSMEAASNMMKAERMGTGHGARQRDVVGETTFKRQELPFYVDTIGYGSRQYLIQQGVPPESFPQEVSPKAFPGNRFVEDPPK